MVVRAEEVPQLNENNNLQKGAGEKVPLKRNGYFQRRPYLQSTPLRSPRLDTSGVLMNTHDERVDHWIGHIVSSGECIHDPAPNASRYYIARHGKPERVQSGLESNIQRL